MSVKFRKLHPEARPFKRATNGSAGYDIYALEGCVIDPGETKVIKTGIAVAVPEGYNMEIRPRSGHSLKTPLRIPNSPGTVDSDYRGEVGVIVENTCSHSTLHISKGMKLAQAVFVPVKIFDMEEVDELPETDRGDGGYGSTGN